MKSWQIAEVIFKSLPHLLDMRAVSLLAANSAAAAVVSHALHAYLQPLSPSNKSSHQTEVVHKAHALISALTVAPSLPAFAAGACAPLVCLCDDQTESTAALSSTALAAVLTSLCGSDTGSKTTQEHSPGASIACLSAQLLRHSRSIAATADRTAAAAVACELSLLASAGFRHALLTPIPSNSALTASDAEVLLGSSDVGRVSDFLAAQAAALRACACAIEARGHAKAALHAGQTGCKTDEEEGEALLAVDGCGRWHLAHALLHTTQCCSLLRRELGLGVPLMSPRHCSSHSQPLKVAVIKSPIAPNDLCIHSVLTKWYLEILFFMLWG
jgi:hypothetical protein